jgi:hypothetical protein
MKIRLALTAATAPLLFIILALAAGASGCG